MKNFLKKFQLKKAVTNKKFYFQGQKLPKGWGIAWWEFDIQEAIIFPMPLNFVTGWVRNLYYTLLKGPNEKYRHKVLEQLSKEYLVGYRNGFLDGEKEALKRLDSKNDGRGYYS